MSKQNTNAAAKPGSKAGTAQSPQDSAGKVLKTKEGHVVAPGHSFQSKGGHIGAGSAVTADNFKTAKDPSGKTEFKRQLDKGAIVLGKVRTSDDFDGERAGGGTIDNGGADGAGPSAAQIAAAEAGNDPGAAAVVDAALSGTPGELAEANGAPAADATGKGE